MAPDRPVSDAEKRSLAAFAQAMPGPVLLVDAAMRMLAANSAARSLLPALQPGDPLPMGLRAPEVLDAVRRVCAGSEPETARWIERVPVEQVFEVRVARVVLDGAFAVAIAMTDLTEAMRAERMRTDFVANASHELRTPLASLMGFIETLQGPARDDVAARVQFLAIMREQALRMSRLVDDLLSLSRIEQTQHLRPQGSVDLVAIVRHVIETLAPLAAESSAQVRFQGPESAIAPGDRDELIRLAENLIENAIKYGGGDDVRPQVDVAISREGGQWLLSVRDNGPGVAPEHIPRLTERFFRTDAGASRAKGGTGLGLAIVKHILVRHRGRLVIESKVGEGALFRAFLPGG
jgi:two-component system phosphate regulon sensor histidine kinase PhoR